eukprot:TRINITY_DN4711_c0_g12_i1.p1 TRINITY_DN4711_c0_g12~~TRINITY_DN4711_c0_g12_i1.p1  ORF type:complete len:404 (+),score=86.53 TRINITY_DN4711_c0_g12_i1:78-1289(+)
MSPDGRVAPGLIEPFLGSRAEVHWQLDDLRRRVEAASFCVYGPEDDNLEDAPAIITDEMKERMQHEIEQGKMDVQTRIDARGEKHMIRQVDIVLLKLHASHIGGKVLIETAREYGKKRIAEARLPGLKRMKGETTEQVALRIIEQLGFEYLGINLQLNESVTSKEEKHSESTGILTIYQKTFLRAHLGELDNKAIERIGLKTEGAVIAGKKLENGECGFYSWMTEPAAKKLKVALGQNPKAPRAQLKCDANNDTTIVHQVEVIKKKVDALYKKDKQLNEYARLMNAVEEFLEADNSSVECVLKQQAARRRYVLEHDTALRGFAKTLHEIEDVKHQLNPPQMQELSEMNRRLGKLEAGASVVSSASSRLHGQVAKIAQDYHRTMTGITAQMLAWDAMLDEKLGN